MGAGGARRLFDEHIRWVALLMAMVGAVLFSNKAILAKLMYLEGADALDVITLRMVFALPFFLMMAVWLHVRSPCPLTRYEIIQLWLVGFLGYYLASILDFVGLEYISTGLERLLLFLVPSIVLLISHFFLHRPVVAKQWWAMCVAYAGIVLVFAHEVHLVGPHVVLGSVLVLGSALAYSLYLVISGGALVQRLGAVRLVAYAMLISTVFSVLHFAWVRDVADLNRLVGAHPRLLVYSLMIAVLGTVFPTVMTMFAVSRLGSAVVAQIGMLGPISMLLMGSVFLNEPITVFQLVGTFLVLLGMTLVGRVAIHPVSR